MTNICCIFTMFPFAQIVPVYDYWYDYDEHPLSLWGSWFDNIFYDHADSFQTQFYMPNTYYLI